MLIQVKLWIVETSRAREAIFSSSVSTNGQLYTPETYYMMRPLFVLGICT